MSIEDRPPLSAPLRGKGVLTIPQRIREQLHLQAGDNLLVAVEDGRIILTPAALLPRDQQWFWTRKWQRAETEADADLAEGHAERYNTDAEFLDSLTEY